MGSPDPFKIESWEQVVDVINELKNIAVATNNPEHNMAIMLADEILEFIQKEHDPYGHNALAAKS